MSTEPRVDPALKAWASPRQAEIIDMVNQCGSINAAAETLQISRSTIYDYIRTVTARRDRQEALKTRGATLLPQMEATEVTDRYDADGKLEGFAVKQRVESTPGLGTADAPMPGFVYKRVSTLYDREGQKALEWQIQSPERRQQWEAAKAAYAALAEPLKGLSPLVVEPAGSDANLLTVYPMGDPHFGMYAWARETGADFDLETAERLTVRAVDRLVALSPPSETAILLNLGDFFHADDHKNQTPHSGNPLDVDTRHIKVVEVGIKAMRWAVLRLLEKHRYVRVRNVPGNHDPNAHLALAFALAAYFENNPRVTVDMSPSLFTFYQFGKVLIGECHGDTAKPADLPGVMMNDAREHISHTEFWVWHCGHVHHDSVKEYQNVLVETHRTLAGKDAWHTGRGYRSGRTMKAITYHRDHGEVIRQTCDISAIQ